MNAPIETILRFIQSSNFVAVLLDALLKSLIVLALAGGACFIWRRASAAARHWIWFLAVISLPLLPPLSRLVPSWQKPLWSVSTSFDSGNRVSLALELAPANPAGLSADKSAALPGHVGNYRSNDLQIHSRQIAANVSTNWLLVAFAGWCVGVLLMLISIVTGQLRLAQLARQSQRLHDEPWQRLLDAAREELELRRDVVLRQAAGNVMPLTWGWWKPVILLPAEAGQWPEERRRVVLLHELAHVKRQDCLTHFLARIVCALYWFNPLVWVAARRMCVERERAADDLVLNGGCKASDYAGHLVDIARSFRRVPQASGIAMARASGLEKRVAAIVDGSRVRQLRPSTIWAFLILAGAVIFCVGGWSAESSRRAAGADSSLRQQQIDQLKAFSTAKEKQAKTLAEAEGEQIGPDYQRLFDAATRGDANAVTNLFADFKNRHGQYGKPGEHQRQSLPHTDFWSPVLEICLAYDHLANCDPKYTQIAVDDVISSIPRGSIYFGGTDPGRGLPTAFSKSQIDADPFYTLTQNALADGSYLAYLRNTYGERRHWLKLLIEARAADDELRTLDREFQQSRENLISLASPPSTDDSQFKAAADAAEDLRNKIKKRTDEILAAVQARTEAQQKAELLNEPPRSIYTPSEEDSQKSFTEYTADAERRLMHDEKFPNEPRQLKPGEGISRDANGTIQVSGQIAVMSINALLAKIVFDKNPDREFYIEESFPLDWMYPYLEPLGLIMKINRAPLAELSEEVVRKDHDYWQQRVSGMIGDWLTDETPVKTIAEFAEKTHLRKDLSGFKGDPGFVRDNYSPKMFSKWRSSIGDVYDWRLGHAAVTPTPPEYLPKNPAERERMIKAADFAFRQAFALCPYSPEAVYGYVNFLSGQKRLSDALLIAETASHLDPNNGQLKALTEQLKSSPQFR